jgi:hypothetical protein
MLSTANTFNMTKKKHFYHNYMEEVKRELIGNSRFVV